MTYTEADIALCKRLHELGVRPEIREGDWILSDNQPFLIDNPTDMNDVAKVGFRKAYPLLFTWERAREWLRERDWNLVELRVNDISGESAVFIHHIGKVPKYGKGRTDLEAILSVCLQVAEGEKE